MGLLDRFKKDPGPDALTWEAVARARAVPGVAGAEAVDADTVHVTWVAHPGTTTVSLAEVREDWGRASGFARIELMDQVVAGLAPPPAGMPADPEPADREPVVPEPAPPDRVAEVVEADPPAAEPARPSDPWTSDRQRLGVAVGHPRGGLAAVRWPLVSGALEARAVLDGADVGASDLERWGVDPDEVQAAAVASLSAADPGLDPIAPGQPAWVPTNPADHPPAWLAAPGRLLSAAGLSSAVALAPTPTELVLVDPDAGDLLASVLAGTQSIVAEAAEVLLAAPMLVSAGGAVEWSPAADHPCAGLVADLRAAAP